MGSFFSKQKQNEEDKEEARPIKKSFYGVPRCGVFSVNQMEMGGTDYDLTDDEWDTDSDYSYSAVESDVEVTVVVKDETTQVEKY